ncbi:MAG: site-2 protease family protein [Clostridia bacterium]|nr:site-2 protease family protein [Clostridia bacterium]
MEKLKFKIHPTFIVFACILVYFNKLVLFANYLLVILIHELSHAFVAKRLGYKINYIKLIPFGICLDINGNDIMPNDEIKIALAGPISNFILSLFILALWWMVPSTYNYTYLFCYANLITAVFNLIPAFPLDGGRVLLSVFKRYSNSNQKAVKVCKLINVVVSVLLLIMFIISCFFEVNFTYLFVMFCILSGVFDNNKNQRYSFINYSNKKKISKILRVKTLCVDHAEPLYKVCKHIDNFSYLKIIVCDSKKNILGELNESEILSFLENISATTSLGFVLKYKNRL